MHELIQLPLKNFVQSTGIWLYQLLTRSIFLFPFFPSLFFFLLLPTFFFFICLFIGIRERKRESEGESIFIGRAAKLLPAGLSYFEPT